VDRRERIRKVVVETAGKAIATDPEESLFETGILDSFVLPDLVSAIEKEFDVQVPDADLNPRKFDSIARIDAYLESRIQ
jgi:acyl carrier protein